MLTMLVPSGSLVGAPGSPTGLPTSFPEAISVYDFPARDGDGAANAGLGTMELFGWGVEQDYRKALDHFRAANDRGHARGKTGMGIMYANGHAIAPDYPKAFRFLTEGSVAVRLQCSHRIVFQGGFQGVGQRCACVSATHLHEHVWVTG
jgi:SEL1 protein